MAESTRDLARRVAEQVLTLGGKVRVGIDTAGRLVSTLTAADLWATLPRLLKDAEKLQQATQPRKRGRRR